MECVCVYTTSTGALPHREALDGLHANSSRYLCNTMFHCHNVKTVTFQVSFRILLDFSKCFQLKVLHIAPLKRGIQI